MTVRELCRAHDIKTLDEQDELLVKLAQDRDALLNALKNLAHLGDASIAASVKSALRPEECATFDLYVAQARDAINQAEAHR